MTRLAYNPVIVALDVPDRATALRLAEALAPFVGGFKVGAELFTAEGPDLVRDLKRFGRLLFLDLKFHDIPNTVAGAVSAATRLGVDMLTVHVSGGREMLVAAEVAARRAAECTDVQPPLVLGVTVLTSLDAKALVEVGVSTDVSSQVLRLARLAVECGLRGLVCSGHELVMLRNALPAEVKLVVPGIRPGAAGDDQKRVLGPREAIESGADWIVVGRPITRAPDPVRAAREIMEGLERGVTGSDAGAE